MTWYHNDDGQSQRPRQENRRHAVVPRESSGSIPAARCCQILLNDCIIIAAKKKASSDGQLRPSPEELAVRPEHPVRQPAAAVLAERLRAGASGGCESRRERRGESMEEEARRRHSAEVFSTYLACLRTRR